jgi:hypothetical protein
MGCNTNKYVKVLMMLVSIPLRSIPATSCMLTNRSAESVYPSLTAVHPEEVMEVVRAESALWECGFARALEIQRW